MAVAAFHADEDELTLTPLGYRELDYPEQLRRDILAALPPAGCSAEQLTKLDTRIGRAFADAAATVIDEIADGRADLGGARPEAVVARHLDDRPAPGGGRDPEPVARTLHDEHGHAHRLQLSQPTRRQDAVPPARGLERKGEAEHRRRSGRRRRTPSFRRSR